MRDSQRYPYTYAADYLRMKVGNDYDKGLISRAAASRVRHLIAEAIGMSDEEIAVKLAEKYIEENA